LDDSEITPVVPEPPRKSPKDKKKKKRKRVAQQDADGRLVIRLKKAGPAQKAEAAKDEGRPAETADILESVTVHSAQNDAVLETVDAPALMLRDQAPEEQGARDPTDTKRDTVPVSPPSSPVSTAATAVAARQVTAKRTVREQAEEIMSMLETAMERVCAWSERVEAHMSESAGREVMIWKKGLANCEESLRRKPASLTEAEKGQAELRQALITKEVKLAAARVELEAERRKRAGTDQLREELRKAQADVKSLRR
jgi:hypothetical protein